MYNRDGKKVDSALRIRYWAFWFNIYTPIITVFLNFVPDHILNRKAQDTSNSVSLHFFPHLLYIMSLSRYVFLCK